MGMRELWLNVVQPWQERKRWTKACTASAPVRQPTESRQQRIRQLKRYKRRYLPPPRVFDSGFLIPAAASLIFAAPLTSNRAMIGFLVRFSFRVTACSVLLGSALATVSAPAARAQDNQLSISWEVRNRFRLFREERDFRLHVESGLGRSVLASEQALELQSDGRGWARNMVNRLCIDLQGPCSEPCSLQA